MNSINKAYLQDAVHERIEELRKRYRLYCNRIDDDGSELSASGAASKRHRTKRDMMSLYLIEELLGYITVDFFLGENAEEGFELLCEPNEWYRARMEKKV